jgi:hypothetical protein
VARPSNQKRTRELPEPLPPETRTVGQLVAETLRLYGRRVWASLAIGLPPAALSIVGATLSRGELLVVLPIAGALLATASYVAAIAVAHDVPLRERRTAIAYLVGVLVFLPFPFLAVLYVLPGLAWLALFGLSVPAAMVEGLGVRAAFSRGLQLARADYIHALGGLATLAIVVITTQFLAALLLQDFADNTARAAGFIAGVVISPILFLGAALLYEDQAARLVARR